MGKNKWLTISNQICGGKRTPGLRRAWQQTSPGRSEWRRMRPECYIKMIKLLGWWWGGWWWRRRMKTKKKNMNILMMMKKMRSVMIMKVESGNSQQLALDSELPGNKQARLASKKGFWCPKQPSLCWPIPIIVRRRILRILLSDGGSYIIVWRRMSDENVRRMEKDISTSFVFHELQCRGYKNWRLTHNLRVTKNSESFSTAPLIRLQSEQEPLDGPLNTLHAQQVRWEVALLVTCILEWCGSIFQ